MPTHRSFAIQKIFDLHEKKGYKPETLFVASNLFDRYLCAIGPGSIRQNMLTPIAATCMLMAAKLEEPISPSFNRMIALLTPQE
jgi:hypothetical protein